MKFSIATTLCGAMLLTSTVTWAGDINNSSNHSAAFARTLTRNASTEADAAVYNPAGTAFAKAGLQISLHNQHYLKYDTLVSTADGNEYTADDPVFFYPGLNLVYKWAELPLAFSMHLGVPTGGGSKSFNSGHPIFADYTGEVADFVNNEVWTALAERNGTTFEEARDNAGPAVDALLDPSQAYIKGSSMFLGATFNVAYAFADWGSVSVGVRATQGKGTYDAFGFYNIENTVVGDFAETQEPLPDEISINVKTEEVGKGVNGILGLHLKPLDNLEIAAQWQLNTKMKLERTFELESDLNEDGYLNSTTAADADPYRIDAEVSRRIFPKDENRKDIPGIISMGVKYGATSDIDVEFGLNYYQNEQAKWGQDDQGNKTGEYYVNSYEASVSGEWKQDWGVLSGGYLYSTAGVEAEGQGYLTYSIPSHSIAAGGRYIINDAMSMDLGVLHVIYESDTNASGSLEYRKGASGLVVGLDYAW